MIELTDAERTELMVWVTACQIQYHIDNTPNNPFIGLGDTQEQYRAALVGCVNELLSARAATPQPAAKQAPAPGYCKHCKQYTIEEPLPAQAEPVTQTEAAKARWLTSEAAAADPLFQRASSLMGTNTWFQNNTLRNVLNYVLGATETALRAENARLREDIGSMARADADRAFAALAASPTQPRLQPLTEAEIDNMLGEANRGFCIERGDYFKAVRDTERHFGITAQEPAE